MACVSNLYTFFFNEKLTEKDLTSIFIPIIAKEQRNISFYDISRIADWHGSKCNGFKVNSTGLFAIVKSAKAPVIVHLKLSDIQSTSTVNGHFALLVAINDNFVYLKDPSMGNRVLSIDSFLELFTGNLLVIGYPVDTSFNKQFCTNQMIKYRKMLDNVSDKISIRLGVRP